MTGRRGDMDQLSTMLVFIIDLPYFGRAGPALAGALPFFSVSPAYLRGD